MNKHHRLLRVKDRLKKAIYNRPERQLFSMDVAGSEPSVVFLHGLGGTHRYWLSVMDDVRSNVHLLFVDLLGFGDSPRPYCRYTLDLHVSKLRNVLNGRKNLTLVGHSLGSAIALAYAAKYPEDVNKLVLISLPYFGDKHAAYRWLRHSPSGWLLTNMLTMALTCLVSRALAKRILPLFVKGYPRVVLEDLVKHNIFSSTSSLWDALYREDLAIRASLPSKMPVVCIHAEDDSAAPVKGVKKLVRQFPNWRLYLLNKSGHQPWLHAPQTCMDIILGVPLLQHSDLVSEFE
jgi:pimeloyl-ACP methyl ester carboxylesterase